MGTSRAAALLESLAGRDVEDIVGTRRKGRTWRTSVARPGDDGPDEQIDHSNSGRGSSIATLIERTRLRGRIPPLMILALAVVAVAIWWSLAAPAPMEERMRDVSATDASTADGVLDLSDHPDASTGTPGSTVHVTGPDESATIAAGATVDVTSPQRITVHVAGAVMTPGVVDLPAGGRVNDAIAAAGGLRPDADPDRLNLATVLGDGWRILVPIKGQELSTEVVLPDGATATVNGPTPDVPGAVGSGENKSGLVDINTASPEELESLPGVGPATAAAIVAKRESDGPFKSVDSLIEVRGIGQVKLEGMRELVTVG